MKFPPLTICALLIALASPVVSAATNAAARNHPAPMRVVYPATESSSDTRFNDLLVILKTSLDKTVAEYGPYTLECSRSGMNEARYLAELANPAGQVNIAWSGTSEKKERELRAVRIPLRKGILGYRVALIARERQHDFDQVKTLDDLKRVTVGQGIGWGDVAIFEANGIKVHTAGYESLFKMVAASRVDMFPRGISEAFVEYQAHRTALPNLAVEKTLVLYYPWPYYFFFNKSNTALAKRIETGLRKMIRDGSFDAIFMKFNRASIEKADFKHRRIIRLRNPYLPKDTPLDDPSLWFNPAAPISRNRHQTPQ